MVVLDKVHQIDLNLSGRISLKLCSVLKQWKTFHQIHMRTSKQGFTLSSALISSHDVSGLGSL